MGHLRPTNEQQTSSPQTSSPCGAPATDLSGLCPGCIANPGLCPGCIANPGTLPTPDEEKF